MMRNKLNKNILRYTQSDSIFLPLFLSVLQTAASFLA
jgi:hypothetical protein